MKITTLFFFISIFLLSCESNTIEENLVDVSLFEIDNTALKDGENVRIIGASGNITNEDEMDFYNLIVVKSLETGKVVNVLMINYIFVDEYNRDVNFISFDTPMGKLSAMAHKGDLKSGTNTKDIELPKFDKVLVDLEYLTEDVYNNPTIIGGLGILDQMSPASIGDPEKLKEEALEKVNASSPVD